MENKKGGIFYGWWIVVVCTLIMATFFTLLLSCISLFIVPITEDLGITRSAFGVFSTILMILGMILSPIAGKICAPSYISLHTALSFYGIIPEAVVEITSVTTQKTCRYENAFGQFSYQTIRPRLFWGFEPKTMRDGKQYMMATPEKAIIDLLYLYPQYSTLDEMRELRFDDDWMHDELNKERLLEYTQRISSPVINKRLKLLFKAYEIPNSVILSISSSTPAKVKQY